MAIMDCIDPFKVTMQETKNQYAKGETLYVPCRVCGNCREKRRKEWALRIYHESLTSISSGFWTLTYAPEHLPMINPETGELRTGEHHAYDGFVPTVDKTDLQKWLKRVRFHQSKIEGAPKIRYYAVSEYGGRFGRPHFHIMLFNLLPECRDFAHTTWHSITQCKPFCYERAFYMAKFHVNPSNEMADTKQPESAQMSLGIGAQWALTTGRFYMNLGYIVQNGYRKPIPSYYRKLWKKHFPAQYKEPSRAQMENATRENLCKKLSRLALKGYDDPHYEYTQRQYHNALNYRQKSNTDQL